MVTMMSHSNDQNKGFVSGSGGGGGGGGEGVDSNRGQFH